MHSQLEDLPVAIDSPGAKTFLQSGFGGMTVAFWKMSGVDSRPMLKGLHHGCCPSPHWGYMIKGKMRIVYDDGKEETVSAGDIFYLPAGHNGIADEEVEWLEFSPDKEFRQVMEYLAKQQ